MKTQMIAMTMLAALLLLPAAVYARDEGATIKKLDVGAVPRTARKEEMALQRALAGLKAELAKLRGDLAKLKSENTQLKNKNRRLTTQLAPVKELKKNLAVAYRDLGTAYAHMKKYEMAIDAYKQSIGYDRTDPRVHYNIGLLYQHSRDDTEKAIYHLRLYLRLNPNARDKKEVEYLVRTLSEIIEVEFK